MRALKAGAQYSEFCNQSPWKAKSYDKENMDHLVKINPILLLTLELCQKQAFDKSLVNISPFASDV